MEWRRFVTYLSNDPHITRPALELQGRVIRIAFASREGRTSETKGVQDYSVNYHRGNIFIKFEERQTVS